MHSPLESTTKGDTSELPISIYDMIKIDFQAFVEGGHPLPSRKHHERWHKWVTNLNIWYDRKSTFVADVRNLGFSLVYSKGQLFCDFDSLAKLFYPLASTVKRGQQQLENWFKDLLLHLDTFFSSSPFTPQGNITLLNNETYNVRLVFIQQLSESLTWSYN